MSETTILISHDSDILSLYLLLTPHNTHVPKLTFISQHKYDTAWLSPNSSIHHCGHFTIVQCDRYPTTQIATAFRISELQFLTTKSTLCKICLTTEIAARHNTTAGRAFQHSNPKNTQNFQMHTDLDVAVCYVAAVWGLNPQASSSISSNMESSYTKHPSRS